MSYAPVALFAYNRPWHTQQTVEALLANVEAAQIPLIIFSDAPKNKAASKAVSEVRAYIRAIAGFKSITIVERDTNYGLARSIIDGVTKVCGEYGRVVVLEDDIVVSRYFLKFMNEALDLYEKEERVISIHGYVYPVKATLPETFFLRGADCWGWATWQRGWDLFEADGQALLQQLTQRKLTSSFDFEGAYPYTQMLRNQIRGKNDSWAIRWYASAFLKGKLTLYPGRSLILNIGNDSSGEHCATTNEFAGAIADSPISVDFIGIEGNAIARRAFAEFHKAVRPAVSSRVLRKLTDMVQRAR